MNEHIGEERREQELRLRKLADEVSELYSSSPISSHLYCLAELCTLMHSTAASGARSPYWKQQIEGLAEVLDRADQRGELTRKLALELHARLAACAE